jgi:hypothetical protein
MQRQTKERQSQKQRSNLEIDFLTIKERRRRRRSFATTISRLVTTSREDFDHLI